MQILIATGNKHKLSELSRLLPAFLPSGEKIEYKGLADFNLTLPEETGTTLAQNAQQKALYAARQSGLLALSDDTGLEVDYLNGAPGVHTARYAGSACDGHANNEKLLRALMGVPTLQRSARFITIACLAWPSGKTQLFEGICPGHIATTYHGINGFGYDPLFMVDELGKCFAELTADEKNTVSHRGRAFSKVRDFLLASSKLLS
ncbi:MAG: RdgB/HAM1 family non-canonical purine NTP pyrophosphatase [Elusimicrobiaceae bacterium]|nr:RdgB/HAM1 family non-canonical purine NTP pyrophosphatase [Elusimicrobiaceae bacterium]